MKAPGCVSPGRLGRRRVIKLGGTSVGTADRLETSLGIVEASARERPVLVVTSWVRAREAEVVVVGAAGHEVAVRALHDAFAVA